MGEENKKIPVSQIFEVDDKFIDTIVNDDKLIDAVATRIKLKENSLPWTVNKIAQRGDMSPQAVREHIKNYLENNGKRGLKAEKIGKSWYAKKEDVEEYLNVKL